MLISYFHISLGNLLIGKEKAPLAELVLVIEILPLIFKFLFSHILPGGVFSL